MKDLIVIDDFLPEEEHRAIYNRLMTREWGAVDDNPNDPLSDISGYNSSEEFTGPSTQTIMDYCLEYDFLRDIVQNSHRVSLYNKYDPKTPTYFHTDGLSGHTLIYFPDIAKYNFMMAGETQILIDDHITGVLPVPNRLVAFNGQLWHKGTSFTHDQPRYSFAIQFRETKDASIHD